MAGSLEAAVADGADEEARARLLLGAHLAGRALTLSGLGLVHGIAHAVTNLCGAPHGTALSAVVAEVMEGSARTAQWGYTEVARAMGDRSRGDAEAAAAAPHLVRALADAVGARTTLTALGVRAEDVPGLATAALADAVSRNHPGEWDPEDVAELLVRRIA